MADWIFQASTQEHDLDASIAASPERWWGTPRYRDRPGRQTRRSYCVPEQGR